MHRFLLFLSFIFFTAPAGTELYAGEVLRLAVTTSTRDSGLLDQLIPIFEEANEVDVDVLAVGTGAALKLGERGDADVVLVHARTAEDAFMAGGFGARREDVMFNTFEIVGPASDPAEVRGLSAVDALRKIANSESRFVSRGDDSGTHKRELSLWAAAGGRPEVADYVETGQGMASTLNMADQMGAYCLVDRGTFLRCRSRIQLESLLQSTVDMQNPYGVILVTDTDKPQLANAFVDFLISESTQRRIAEFQIDGEQLFYPLRLGSPNAISTSHVPIAGKHSTSEQKPASNLILDGVREATSLLVRFDPDVMGAAWRSLWISSLSVFLATIVGLPIGILLARRAFVGRSLVVLMARGAMALPTVFVGVICYAVFSNHGPLGALEIIYTPAAIVAGEFILALPMVVSISHGAIRSLDPRIGETARTLGAGPWMRCKTYISEAQTGVILAVLTAFARCITELGIAMMAGGNIKGKTRTLATATALDINKGLFGRGLAVGFLLLLLAVFVTLLIVRVGREETPRRRVSS